MRRREFIFALAGAAAWPLAARAQQAMPVVGFLRSTTLADSAALVAAFRQGLKEIGYVEGQNLTVEYRWAEGHMNPNNVGSELEMSKAEAAARSLNQQVLVVQAGSETEIDAAFERLQGQHVGAVVVGSGAFFLGHRDHLGAVAARVSIPAIYDQRAYVAAGGLMCYGTSITDTYRQVGIYVGRILKGNRPAELPIMQPTKFELIVNLKSAKALGLKIPPTLLALADEVIE